jgi:hypothetical protein
MNDQKQPGDVEYLNYLGSVITNDARCRREIKLFGQRDNK